MYQSFETTAEPQFGGERVAKLRGKMTDLGIDGFLVPRADEYQGEYVPASAERMSWLTGFTGSAGVVLVMADQVIVFVDGRYTTQLKEQVDGNVFVGGDLIGEPPPKWLAAHASDGFRLGIDPWLHTSAEVAKLQKALAPKNGSVVFLASNPLDEIWADRPAEPMGKVTIQYDAQAGVLATEKIKTIAEGLPAVGATSVVLTDPSSVAWAFNVRGADVPHTPHPLARAIIHADGRAEIFLDEKKTGIEQRAYLGQMAEQVAPSDFINRLKIAASDGGAILLDPDLAPYVLSGLIEEAGGKVISGDDPVKIPRATKNRTELEGSTKAHLQDGAAMVEYLHWLDSQEPGTVTEIDAVKALEAARIRVGERMQNPLKDVSFDTISGAGENAAIIHYRVTTTTNRRFKPGEMFLVDSGGQYINGTTDITRTVAFGEVPDEQKRFFTLVLKGMIAISLARFPKGTRGVDLDPLARIALWKSGADYGHGTGHGVGSYLSVHEGPQRISRAAMQELLPGMILSNEPGYYRPGSFGIRIENLVYVEEAEMIEGGDRPMLGFETLTYCPIDRRLILTAFLNDEELRWLNDYHAETRDKLLPLIEDAEVRTWLKRATAPLA
ncbi:aminopeptidase P family protein [Rhizobium sp. TH2]|uniref:aminopeptidase P family protein n=1 Tax=Rhizobium sp. TH2 TaxID=2775403 RepID=UPI0021573B83|nr:aminopeptidase P family protein [Rhizobium sp. TH2]UVC06778.1 aminopeptidase P family protein [Rhizobium sp. TH2]